MAMSDRSQVAAFRRFQQQVRDIEAVSQVKSEMTADGLDDKLAQLEKEEEIDRLLAALKSRRSANA
jgi:phage shock protein A